MEVRFFCPGPPAAGLDREYDLGRVRVEGAGGMMQKTLERKKRSNTPTLSQNSYEWTTARFHVLRLWQIAIVGSTKTHIVRLGGLLWRFWEVLRV